MISDKLLEKMRKMKARADRLTNNDGTTNEVEAQAFAEMLQRMLLEHKLTMTDLEVEQAEAEEPVTRYPIDFEAGEVRGQRQRVLWQEVLASVVARAHFCRILVGDHSRTRAEAVNLGYSKKEAKKLFPDSNRITLVGRKSDCAVAEFLIVTLLRAAERFAHVEYFREYNKGMRHGRAFKEAFLDAFVQRIFERLQEARRSAMESSSTAIVRVNRAERAVEDWLRENCGDRTAKELARKEHDTAGAAIGHQRGRESADKVNLDPRAVSGASAKPVLQ